MKAFRFGAIAAAGLAAAMAAIIPVSAQGELVGGGVVTGSVTGLNFPVPPACLPLCPQAFGFGGTGTAAFQQTDVSNENANVSEGGIAVSASGTSIAENIGGGVGSVANVTVSSSGICIGICAPPPNCIGLCISSDSAGLSGVYVRAGVLVIGVLTGTINLNGSSYTSAVVFTGPFIPNQVTPPVTSASFDAAFVAVGVKA